MHKKAYDTVEWRLINGVMNEIGFPKLFTNWVIKCVSSVSYSILINGRPSPPFKAARGMKQGDPLSHYLFALSIEYLSKLFTNLGQDPSFKYHYKCKKANITHPMFADDLLLFCNAELVLVGHVKQVFSDF